MKQQTDREKNLKKFKEILEVGFSNLYIGKPNMDVLMMDILHNLEDVEESDKVCSNLEYALGLLGKDAEIYKWASNYNCLCHVICELFYRYREDIKKIL